MSVCDRAIVGPYNRPIERFRPVDFGLDEEHARDIPAGRGLQNAISRKARRTIASANAAAAYSSADESSNYVLRNRTRRLSCGRSIKPSIKRRELRQLFFPDGIATRPGDRPEA